MQWSILPISMDLIMYSNCMLGIRQYSVLNLCSFLQKAWIIIRILQNGMSCLNKRVRISGKSIIMDTAILVIKQKNTMSQLRLWFGRQWLEHGISLTIQMEQPFMIFQMRLQSSTIYVLSLKVDLHSIIKQSRWDWIHR